MPSKSKKQQPKSPLPTSSSKQQLLPSSPQTPSHLFPEDEVISNSIDEASTKFPSFIANSSLSCQVFDFDSSPLKGCNIWLSEPCFHALSITPGSIVSVSLASVGRNPMSGFPLSSWASECSEEFGVEREGKTDDRAGDHFVLATAFSGSKLQKNVVRISSSLSYSLGCPSAGRIVFVHPVHIGSLNDLMTGDSKLDTSAIKHPMLHPCTELYLRLLPFKSGASMKMDRPSLSVNGPANTLRQCGNGEVSSPSTPVLKHSRQSSPSPSRFSSLSSEGSASNLRVAKISYSDSVDMQEELGDEAAKKLLEVSAASWLFRRVLLCGNLVTVPSRRSVCFFEVLAATKLLDTGPSDEGFIIDRTTKVHISLGSSLAPEGALERLNLGEIESSDMNAEIGDEVAKFLKELPTGRKEKLWKEYKLLKTIISSSVKNSLSSLGLRPTKGVLLHGPTGTGKTSLAQLCAHDAGVSLFKVNGPEIVGQYYGESERSLHDVFMSANEAAPSVIFIDELDAIAPARKEGGDELSQRMVATLLHLMDGVSRTDGLLVIAATNRVECIEPALRRPGRLDREIEIGVPSADQRFNILETLLSRMEHSLEEDQIEQLAKVTHGFVGADLDALSNEAAMTCLRRHISSNGCEDLPLSVTLEDFETARNKIRPSGMREVILEVPKVDWDDVGGQNEAKAQLMEAVEWPQKHQDAFKRIGTRPPTGVLMFGPPGCSKTLMARAVASKAGLNFLAVKGPELFSKWVGESEKAIRSVFAKARANAPSIIFFDEIDSIASARGREKDGVSVADRVTNQLLVELDGLHARVNVTVIAATNCPENIDSALLRPGRFDRLLYVGPPSEMDRIDIFRVHLRKMPRSSDIDMRELARRTEGCTGADISSICREAAISALDEKIDASEIKMEHLKHAILQVRPSETQAYKDLPEKFQRLVHSKAQPDDLECQPQLSGPKAISFWNLSTWILQFAYRFSGAYNSSDHGR